MIFALDKKELRAWSKIGPFLPTFTGAEMLWVTFRTDPEVIGAILPKPLVAPPEPIAQAFIARYPETNFGVTYNEGALLIGAVFKDEPGGYCLAMPVDDDMALIGGRERYGYPKKIADEITVTLDGARATGTVTRKGHELMHIDVELGDEIGIEALAGPERPIVTDLEGRQALLGLSFLFKFFPATAGPGFEHAPRLLRQPNLFSPRPGLRAGSGKFELHSSITDPLGDIPVREIVSMTYGVYDNVMLPGRKVATVRNPLRFAPYAFFKTDMVAAVDPGELPQLGLRQRRVLKKRVASY
jgi:acetoacetate decarboxylase